MTPSLFIETLYKIGVRVSLNGTVIYFLDGNGLELRSVDVDSLWFDEFLNEVVK